MSLIYGSLMLILYFKKYFRINLPFFSKSCGDVHFVKSVRLLSMNIELINSMQKYLIKSYFIESLTCILKIFALVVSVYKFYDFFKNVFKTKAIQICHTIITYIKSYDVSSYWFALIKIYSSFTCFTKSFREQTLKHCISKLIKVFSIPLPALINVSNVQIIPLPETKFSSRLAPRVTNSKIKHLSLCSSVFIFSCFGDSF